MLKVAVELSGEPESPGEWLADAQAVESAGAEALFLGGGGLSRASLLSALAAVTSRIQIDGTGSDEVARRLARGRLVETWPDSAWLRIPVPTDRADWRLLHEQATGSGAAGVLVQMNPKLLDLLRNPDQDDDRSDLQLAQG